MRGKWKTYCSSIYRGVGSRARCVYLVIGFVYLLSVAHGASESVCQLRSVTDAARQISEEQLVQVAGSYLGWSGAGDTVGIQVLEGVRESAAAQSTKVKVQCCSLWSWCRELVF